MKKKYKIILFITSLLLIALVALVFILILTGEKELRDNNDKTITNIAKKYSSLEIEKMKKDIEHNRLDYSTLKSNYNIQNLRKTYQGYYAIILQDDGKRAFVFMDEEMKLYKVLVIDNIKEKGEYDFIESGKTTKREILEFDKNTVLLPISSVDSTAHIVQEGLFVVTYDRLDIETKKLLDDPIVKSIVFFGNEDFPLKDDMMINLNVPYILEIDKK